MDSLAAPSVQIIEAPNTTISSTPPEQLQLSSKERGFRSPAPYRDEGRDYFAYRSSSRTAPFHSLLEASTVSNLQPNKDGTYIPAKSTRSTTWNTRATSTSDHMSDPQCLSPVQSSGGSFQLLETGCAGSSSEFLSPPQTILYNEDQPYSDIYPPYRSRGDNFGSLTIIKKPQRAFTTPDSKEVNPKKSRKGRGCFHKALKLYEHKNLPYWWIPENPASLEQRRGGGSEVSRQTSSRRRKSVSDRVSRLQIASRTNYPIIARRWSSVELPARQIRLESSVVYRTAFDGRLNITARDDLIPPTSGQRHRRSMFSHEGDEHDIVRIIRARLTLREVRAPRLEIPASITLRRASGEIDDSATPETQDFDPGSSSAAYLITEKDIESITKFIQAKLEHKIHEPDPSGPRHSRSNVQLWKSVRSGSSSGARSVTPKGPASDSGVPLSETQQEKSTSRGAAGFLQITEVSKIKRNTLRRSSSQKSFHEILWKVCGAGSVTTTDDESRQTRTHTYTSSAALTTGIESSAGVCQLPGAGQQYTKGKNKAFDRDKSSIEKWSWGCPQNDNSSPMLPIVSSDEEAAKEDHALKQVRPQSPENVSRSPRQRPSSPLGSREKIRTDPRYMASANQSKHVESFPALPLRKATSDWFSPLPDIVSTPPSRSPRSPYMSREATPKASPRPSLWRRPAYSTPSKCDDTNIDAHPWNHLDHTYYSEIHAKTMDFHLDHDRRWGNAKQHPNAPARTGSSLSMGSSIGVSHHERKRSNKTPPLDSSRRSSVIALLQHVRTIDNIHKGEREEPARKWRPPTACPSPRPPSLSEFSDRASSPEPITIPSPIRPKLERLRRGLVDRMSLIRDFSPPTTKLDHIGIYAKITGAKRTPNFGESCIQQEELTGDAHPCEGCSDEASRTPDAD